MTYPSKKDWWITLLVLPAFVLMPGVGVVLLYLAITQAAPLPILLPGLILSAVGGLILWAYFSTCCEITPSHLLVRFGPLRWTIPLEGITQVEQKKGMSPDWAWGVAWSLDRVVIKYHKRNGRRALLGVAISPEDKEGFLRELGEALLGLQGSGEKAGGAELNAVVHQDDKE
jgi:PH (Pleckstrin Homology) domain-containing protein